MLNAGGVCLGGAFTIRAVSARRLQKGKEYTADPSPSFKNNRRTILQNVERRRQPIPTRDVLIHEENLEVGSVDSSQISEYYPSRTSLRLNEPSDRRSRRIFYILRLKQQ